ncbi:GntR family transcriptional regulator [Paraburkholderia acidisoli]|uniref:FCD domain-containing protein n=1 Tax=Paraburkholderia acidisoli TaxID=2571748 RepID=A0A7Z2JHE0_9BURK|nr:GntR family transcriptional regulator [Paraburkholderia acidisoli]QGZ65632.1 FCD domain-containing protein [Paraburkholderia acidisoli]
MSEQIKRVVKRSTMQESIYAQLRTSLMQGRFEPGTQLTVASLADGFGSSAMPVREALRQLVVENGLIALANGTIQVPEVSKARLLDLCNARIALEGRATEMAAERVDDASIRRLKRLIGEHELAIQHDGIHESLVKNQEFHFLIYQLSGSAVLPQLIETVWLQCGPYMRVITQEVERNETVPYNTAGTDLHHVVVAAMERHDAAAAREAMERDIRLSFDFLLDILERRDSTVSL